MATAAAYKLVDGGGVCRIADGAIVPPDPANRDWQAYLAWRAVPGNVPDPADPPQQPAAGAVNLNKMAAALVAKGLLKPTDIN